MTPEEVKHHIKTYVIVFIALAFLTVVTVAISYFCLLYTSPSPRDLSTSRMPSSA